MNAIREKIFIALGMGSMCWSETPKGVFESTKAKEIGEVLATQIESQIEQLERERAELIKVNADLSRQLYERQLKDIGNDAFEKELCKLINQHSMDTTFETADFKLAKIIMIALNNHKRSVEQLQQKKSPSLAAVNNCSTNTPYMDPCGSSKSNHY